MTFSRHSIATWSRDVRLLIDTHMVIWTLEDSRRMPREGRRLIHDADIVYVSAASVFEIAIKTSNSKLAIRIDGLTERLAAANFEPLPVTWAHAQRAHDIGYPDPFDRLLIAQADVEPLHFLTVEEKLAEFSRMVVTV
jgi:PIN domain nuclease of toxin-antitoxin system